MKFKKALFFGSLLFSFLPMMGWGQKGHDTVAAIAERHLTDSTKMAISYLLDGKSIIYYANWLDNASHTPQYDYTKTWHYKNIDEGVNYENAPLNEKGDIVRAIYDQITILKNDASSKEEKALALKMLVHFLGDLHQPMHIGHATDLGGNTWKVKFFNSPTNLHTLWDTKLPDSAHKWSYSEWADQIDRISDKEEINILDGNVDNWAKETQKLCSKIYILTPKDFNVSYNYIAEWTPVIEQQFLNGGIRLADILNSIFDSNYIPKSNSVTSITK